MKACVPHKILEHGNHNHVQKINNLRKNSLHKNNINLVIKINIFGFHSSLLKVLAVNFQDKNLMDRQKIAFGTLQNVTDHKHRLKYLILRGGDGRERQEFHASLETFLLQTTTIWYWKGCRVIELLINKFRPQKKNPRYFRPGVHSCPVLAVSLVFCTSPVSHQIIQTSLPLHSVLILNPVPIPSKHFSPLIKMNILLLVPHIFSWCK